MAQGDKNLPVKLVVVEPTKIEGEHYEVGTVLNNTPTDLAFELGAAGKVRVWSKELESDMKKRAQAEAEFAKKVVNPQAVAVSAGTPGLTGEQIAEVVKSAIEQGIQAGIALAAAAIPADATPIAEGTGAQD